MMYGNCCIRLPVSSPCGLSSGMSLSAQKHPSACFFFFHFVDILKEVNYKVLGDAPCVPDEVDSCAGPEVWAGEEE
jgi:hypothetical protein